MSLKCGNEVVYPMRKINKNHGTVYSKTYNYYFFFAVYIEKILFS